MDLQKGQLVWDPSQRNLGINSTTLQQSMFPDRGTHGHEILEKASKGLYEKSTRPVVWLHLPWHAIQTIVEFSEKFKKDTGGSLPEGRLPPISMSIEEFQSFLNRSDVGCAIDVSVALSQSRREGDNVTGFNPNRIESMFNTERDRRLLQQLEHAKTIPSTAATAAEAPSIPHRRGGAAGKNDGGGVATGFFNGGGTGTGISGRGPLLTVQPSKEDVRYMRTLLDSFKHRQSEHEKINTDKPFVCYMSGKGCRHPAGTRHMNGVTCRDCSSIRPFYETYCSDVCRIDHFKRHHYKECLSTDYGCRWYDAIGLDKDVKDLRAKSQADSISGHYADLETKLKQMWQTKKHDLMTNAKRVQSGDHVTKNKFAAAAARGEA